MLFFIVNSFAQAQGSLAHEYKLNHEVTQEDNFKAVFIYNFTKYVQWSEQDTSPTFDILIIGESSILYSLKNIAEKRRVGKRGIVVKQVQNINNLGYCHVLFISVSEKKRLKQILHAISDQNTLIISDSEGFAHKGVAINFIYDNGKIKFELNKRAFDRAGLQVSSKLLKLAMIVDEEEK